VTVVSTGTFTRGLAAYAPAPGTVTISENLTHALAQRSALIPPA
jgi:hypothetical protein